VLKRTRDIEARQSLGSIIEWSTSDQATSEDEPPVVDRMGDSLAAESAMRLAATLHKLHSGSVGRVTHGAARLVVRAAGRT
jgi:hypothetical protein